MNSTRSPIRPSTLVRALWAGLAVQVVCTLLPLADMVLIGTTEDHVRSAYPAWSSGEVATESGAILSYMAGIGVLGAVAWLLAIWSARTGKGVRTVVTTLFTVGMAVLLFTATAQGAAYDRIVPAWLGMTTLALTAVPAVAALIVVWTQRLGRPRTAAA